MAQVSRLMFLMRAALASMLAVSATGGANANGHTEAAAAYQAALAAGTVQALEAFIAQYPLSDEANIAFRDIVVIARRSTLEDRRPNGPAALSVRPVQGTAAAGVSPY
jgi:hypothetical protein